MPEFSQFDSGLKCYQGSYEEQIGWWKFRTIKILQSVLNSNVPFGVSVDGSWSDQDYYAYRYFLKYWGYDVDIYDNDWSGR